MFNDFVEQKGVEGLKRWLLIAFETDFKISDYNPVYLDSEPRSAVVQLQYGFMQLDPLLKELFKDAVIRATSEWWAGYKPSTLVQLVRLAGYIRASDILDTLRVLISYEPLESLRQGKIDGKTDDSVYLNTMGEVVRTIQGFAPLPEAERLLSQLFFSNFDHRFATHLFLGLCECKPTRYTDYVPRILDLQASYPGDFSMFYIIRGLVDIVSLRTVVENFDNLGNMAPKLQARFLHLLCRYTWSPARVVDYYYDNSNSTIIIDNDVAMRDPLEPVQRFYLQLSIDTFAEFCGILLYSKRFEEELARERSGVLDEEEELNKDFGGRAVKYGEHAVGL